RPIVVDSRKAKHPGYGTGVLIGVGDHLFIASAAHCIEVSPFVIMTLSTPKEYTLPRAATPLRNRGRVANRDIGFLEIENDPTLPRLTIDRLCPDVPPLTIPPHRPTCVVG